MRRRYRVSAPPELQDTTKDTIETCRRSNDAALQKCGKLFAGIMASKITVVSVTLDVMDLTENRTDPVARAAKVVADVWFDLAAGIKFDLPSIQQRLQPAKELLVGARASAQA